MNDTQKLLVMGGTGSLLVFLITIFGLGFSPIHRWLDTSEINWEYEKSNVDFDNEKEWYKWAEDLKYENKTAIFFDSSKRLEKTISNLLNFLSSDRRISICKEMTKLHEEVISDKLSNILDKIKKEKISLKGEIVIVIEGTQNIKTDLKIDSKVKKEFLKRFSASESAKLISLITKQNKRDIYKFLIET